MSKYENTGGDVKLTTGTRFLFVLVNWLQKFYLNKYVLSGKYSNLFSDDSDMNLIIDKENFTSAAPMHDHGLGYIGAGARATYGFQKGKVFYEVKVSRTT